MVGGILFTDIEKELVKSPEVGGRLQMTEGSRGIEAINISTGLLGKPRTFPAPVKLNIWK